MERYICIHSHFYQPPRENPWLETVEQQESAYPFHDWNQRITAECYGPNASSRIVDEKNRIIQIVNNYSRISFNFGPTLLSWLEENSPGVYNAILAADRESQQRFSGHGSAIAQVYNHIILPLATRRDKETQVIWGKQDFIHRFQREPKGMWLAETAVDTETLEVLAENGIKFTILSPHQAAKTRAFGARNWKDVSGARVDPTRPYLCKLPSGNSISLFFYDGPISRAVAFEKLLNSGEQFALRLASGFNDHRDWPQLMHIATDGESYGHHHAHGDMALSYALKYIEEKGLARLTNYGEYLEKHPPQAEAQIAERTAWSCAHGVERWNSDCGCSIGTPGFNQQWRGPLRSALDFLRDATAPLYEEEAALLLQDPWAARNEYIQVVLDRTSEEMDWFFECHAARELNPSERVRALQLLEMQRHAQLMYTSCGWFFDEVSGLETMQVIEYAGRVVQLAYELFPSSAHKIEDRFVELLSLARSNLEAQGTAAQVYGRQVKPAAISLMDVAAHYAISSLFEPNAEEVPIYCYGVERTDFRIAEFGRSRMVVGRARICSKITKESGDFTFGVLHFGDHNLSAGVRAFAGDESYAAFAADAAEAFSRADMAHLVRVLDRHFGATTYSLRSLFSDERRKILDRILSATMVEAETTYRQVYDAHAPLLRYLSSNQMRKPKVLSITAEFVLNAALRREFSRDDLDLPRVRAIMQQVKEEGVPLDRVGLGFVLEQTLDRIAEQFAAAPNSQNLENVRSAVVLAAETQMPVNLWQAQNVFYNVARSAIAQRRFNEQDQWSRDFADLGEKLFFRMDTFTPSPQLAIAG